MRRKLNILVNLDSRANSSEVGKWNLIAASLHHTVMWNTSLSTEASQDTVIGCFL